MLSKLKMKTASRKAIEAQDWMVYIRPGHRPFNNARTLVAKVENRLQWDGQEPDAMEAMAFVADLATPILPELYTGDPRQRELLLRRPTPDLPAIHYLGDDDQLWASDLEFFPY